jgi:hypothetical protein
VSALEGVIALVAELIGGIDGWLRPRNRLKVGQLLRARQPVIVGGAAGEKGRFLATLPKGAVVRVERVSGGDAPICWVSAVDDALRRRLIPKDRRGRIAPGGYTLELRAEEYREQFDAIRKADPSLRSG